MYILTEQVMNGTVTMGITSTGIEAETFAGAIAKIKALPSFDKAKILEETADRFSYEFPNVYGCMKNVDLKTI